MSAHICPAVSFHPSLRAHPTPAGRDLLPGLMYALVSDHEKYVSDFTLSSAGLVHEPPSIIAATSQIPWGSIKWNEYKILPGAFLRAQKHMINVLLKRGLSVLDAASPLLFTVTKTMTRMRFTYLSTH